MELKCTNPNCEIVLAKKLNHMELFLLKSCKNCIQKMNPISYFSQEDALSAGKIGLSITFS